MLYSFDISPKLNESQIGVSPLAPVCIILHETRRFADFRVSLFVWRLR